MIIYKTINLINNKIYIGQTNGNRSNYYGGGKLFRYALKKYGKENFKKEIIIEGNFNQKLIDELEIHYIRLYNSTHPKIGYNLETGGMGGRAMKHSIERRLRQSIKFKEICNTPEYKLKLSIAVKKSMTLERRKKISDDLKLRVVTEETRLKLSKAKLGCNSKGYIEVFKDDIKIHDFVSLEQCCKILKLSTGMIRPLLNTNTIYRGYIFKRLNLKNNYGNSKI